MIEEGYEGAVDIMLAADQEATSSSCTRDAYGKCVPAGCASYFDGCNTCNVGAVLGCTMMYCDTPQEPKWGDNNPKSNLLLEEKQVFPLTKISISV